MNLEKIDESDKAMKEIKSSLEDIENFKQGEYKKLVTNEKIGKDKVRRVTDKAKASSLMATDILEEEEEE